MTAGEDKLTLNARGARLVGELLRAMPEEILEIEELLERRAVGRPAESEMVSPGDAAAILGVSRATVVRWSRQGLLTDHKVGAHHRFSRAEALELRQRRKAQAVESRSLAIKARETAVDQRADLEVARFGDALALRDPGRPGRRAGPARSAPARWRSPSSPLLKLAIKLQ